MANRTNSNPIVIDTWGADVVLATKGKPLVISKVIVYSGAIGDIFSLDNANGDKVFQIVQSQSAGTVQADFNPQRFNEGVTLDVSDCAGMSANDLAFIYLA